VLYLGAVRYDAMDSMGAFVTLLLTVIAPWAAVLTVGYRLHGGRYRSEDLRAFTSGGGGRYWYTHGVNPRAVAAFATGSAVGVLWVNNPLYVGPLTELTGGVDLSLPVSFALTAAVYALLCRAWPESGEESS
jgi:purine-cytosine permease-like protein